MNCGHLYRCGYSKKARYGREAQWDPVRPKTDLICQWIIHLLKCNIQQLDHPTGLYWISSISCLLVLKNLSSTLCLVKGKPSKDFRVSGSNRWVKEWLTFNLFLNIIKPSNWERNVAQFGSVSPLALDFKIFLMTYKTENLEKRHFCLIF